MKAHLILTSRQSIARRVFWVFFFMLCLFLSNGSAVSVFAQTYLNKSVLSAEGNTKVTILDTGTGGKITFDTEGVERVQIDGSGNVGIGKTPTTKLDVNGSVLATSLDISNAAHVHIYLTACGSGPCPGNHTLNSWTEVSNLGYSWIQDFNNATDVFTHNGTGRITVNKTGTYRVRLSTMVIPASGVGVPMYVCPFINGAVNCNAMGIYSSGIVHAYYPPGTWRQTEHEFVYNLTQGAIVGWGYYPVTTLTYWGYDYYTALEISEIN
jgi:hypothetical protein